MNGNLNLLCELRHKDGRIILPGTTMTSFRGDRWTLRGISQFAPNMPGKVYVQSPDTSQNREFNAAVFECTVVLKDSR